MVMTDENERNLVARVRARLSQGWKMIETIEAYVSARGNVYWRCVMVRR